MVFVSGIVSMAQPQTGNLEKSLAALKLELAPDHRTAIFDVTGKPSGHDLVLSGTVHDRTMKDAVVSRLKAMGWTVQASKLQTLPSPAVGNQTHGVVCVSVLNMRTEPEHAAEMGTQAILGTPLKILKKEGGWYLVQTPDRYLGWTDDRMQVMDDSAFSLWQSKPKVIVTETYSHVRTGTGPNDGYVGDLVAGGLLAFIGDRGTHWEVGYPDGRTGFVPQDHARQLNDWKRTISANEESIISTAQRFFGVPYFWGGTSTKAMDCSGFVKTVYFLNGIYLPRDASQQVNVGILVDGGPAMDAYQPGDLLFFGFKAHDGKKERVTHVGISLGGQRYIHESVDIHVNSLNPSDQDYSGSRREMFIRARRILGAGVSQGVFQVKDMPEYGASGQREH
jgi:hypothetical protein